MKKMKIFLSLVLVLIMCFSVVPMTDFGIEAEAAESWNMPITAYLKIGCGFACKCRVHGGNHKGQDFPANKGTKVMATKSGTVVVANLNCTHVGNSCSICYGWGKYVKIKHDDGYSSLYAHLSSVSVKEGDRVKQGDKIGGVGTTGFSTGNHLHFEIYNKSGNRVDPMNYIDPSHDHSYTTKQETAHPHKYYEECSCGDKKYTGKENELDNCVECIAKYEKNFTGKMKVTTSSKTIKSLPYSSSETIKTLGKNDTVSVVSYVYNKYGNLWYKTSSGNYIHSNYLEVVENDSLPPSNYLNAKFKVVCSEKNVKNDPISSSDTIKKIYRNEIINIIGYMYNEYGNLWYILEDGGYVPHHYFSVVSSNIRTPSNYINANLISRADKSLRLEPSGSSEISGSVNKNSTVNVHGYVYNRFGNLWYMTNKEEFIFFSYLEQDTENSLVPSNYKYHTFTASDSKVEKTEPYEVAENNRIVSKGETVTTVGYLTNLYGNKWYITNEDYYVYPSNLKCIHQYNSKTTKPASCTETGIKTFTCSLCSVSYTEAIAKKSHSIVTIPAVSATCTKTGLTEGKKCSTCGTVTVAQQTVAKKSHSYSSSITTQPTCTKEGIKTYKCSCGANYTETIAKKSHTIVTIPAVAATCKATGLTEGKKCSVCGTITAAQQTVAKIACADNNGDGKCDNCGANLGTNTPTTPDEPENKPCSCNCHKGGISGFFFKLINFFEKLFGKNKVCACGVKH